MTKSQYMVYICMGLIAIVCLVLILSGCSGEVQVTDPYPDMPSDLLEMQGAWEALTTNSCTQCGATVDGYTIRLRFQGRPDQPLIKRNASIHRLDEQKKLIILNNGNATWRYFIGLEDNEEHFELEFYDTTGNNWKRLHMKRSRT